MQAQPGFLSSAKDFQGELRKSLKFLDLGIFFPPDCRREMMSYVRVKQPSTPAKKDHVPFSAKYPGFFNRKTLLVIWPTLVIAAPTSFSIRTTWLQHKISVCVAGKVVVSGWKLLFTHHSVLVFPAGGGMLILSVQTCSLKFWSATEKTNVKCSIARSWRRNISAVLVQLRR